MWKPLKGRNDTELRARLKQLAERYPRYGYPTLHDMLRAEGLVRNLKRTYRIYQEKGLQVRRKRRKKAYPAADPDGHTDTRQRALVGGFHV